MFSNPGAFWLTLLIIPIVWAFRANPTPFRRRIVVGTARLWRDALRLSTEKNVERWEEDAATARRVRFREAAASVATVLLAALAAAGPRFGTDVPRGRIVVVDASASMRAAELGAKGVERRFDVAKSLLTEELKKTRSGSPSAVVVAGETPFVLCGTTESRRAALDAARRLKIDVATGSSNGAAGVADLRAAVAVARTTLAARRDVFGDDSEIVVLTDAPETELAAVRAPDVRVETFGTPGNNVALTALRARREFGDSRRFDVLVAVANFGAEPIKVRLKVELDGAALDVWSLELVPGETVERIARGASEDGGTLRAALESADGNAFGLSRSNRRTDDDGATARLPERRTTVVRRVSGDFDLAANGYLARASTALGAAFEEEGKEAESGGTSASRDVVRLVDGAALPARFAEGSTFVVAPTGRCELFEVGEEIGSATVESGFSDSPDSIAATGTAFDGATLGGVRRLKLASDAELAERGWNPPEVWAQTADGTPVEVGWTRIDGDARVVCWAFDPESSGETAFDVAFPLAVAEALELALGRNAFGLASGLESPFSAGRNAFDDALERASESDLRTGPGASSVGGGIARRRRAFDLRFPAAFAAALAWGAGRFVERRRRGKRGGRGEKRERRRTAALVGDAAVAIAFVVAASASLGDWEIGVPTRARTTVFALDRSSGVDETTRAAVVERIRRLQADARDGVKRRIVEFDGGNVATGLLAALASTGPERGLDVALISGGDSVESVDAFAIARRGGVPVSIVETPRARAPFVRKVAVVAPETVEEGSAFRVLVDVWATDGANDLESALVSLYRNGIKIDERRGALAPGANRFRFETTTEGARGRELIFGAIVSFDAETGVDGSSTLASSALEPESARASARAVVSIAGKTRLLSIGDDSTSGFRAFATTLRERNFAVETVEPANAPTTSGELAAFDAVALVDVAASDLPSGGAEAIRTFVRELGGGLAIVGGPRSFGLGGWRGSPLESVFPVSCEPEPEPEKNAVAVALVVDRSGSTGGDKERAIRRLVAETVETLGDDDSLTVIAFDAEPRVVWEARRLRDVDSFGVVGIADSVAERIGAIRPSAGTNVGAALVKAAETLRASSAFAKRAIVFSDFSTAPADFDRIVGDAAAEGVVVSTVAVGDGADVETARRIADVGGGTSTWRRDLSEAGRVAAREVASIRRNGAREEPFFARLATADSDWRALGLDSAPPLGGLVETRLVPGARALATADFELGFDVADDDASREDVECARSFVCPPLLATRRVGLGVSTAFASDVGRWSSDWRNWDGWGDFWEAVFRRTARKSGAARAAATIRPNRDGTAATAFVDALDADERFGNDARWTLAVVGPDGRTTTKRLVAVAPGRRAGTFETSVSGVYRWAVASDVASAFEPAADEIVFRGAFAVDEASNEARLGASKANRRFLADLARATGGKSVSAERFVADPASVAVSGRAFEGRRRFLPFAPWALGCAAFLSTFLCWAERRRRDVDARSRIGKERDARR